MITERLWDIIFHQKQYTNFDFQDQMQCPQLCPLLVLPVSSNSTSISSVFIVHVQTTFVRICENFQRSCYQVIIQNLIPLQTFLQEELQMFWLLLASTGNHLWYCQIPAGQGIWIQWMLTRSLIAYCRLPMILSWKKRNDWLNELIGTLLKGHCKSC